MLSLTCVPLHLHYCNSGKSFTKLLQTTQDCHKFGLPFLYSRITSHVETIQSTLYLYVLTPSKNGEEPPLLGEAIEHQHQQEVGHDAFTQHPAEGSQEEVLRDGSDRLTGSLKWELVKLLSSPVIIALQLARAIIFYSYCNILHAL